MAHIINHKDDSSRVKKDWIPPRRLADKKFKIMFFVLLGINIIGVLCHLMNF